MIRALTTAATGLEAQQANVERISNDLANVNTDAYKRGRTEFQELLYETKTEPGAQQGAATTSPVGVQNGMGVKVGASYQIHEQGPARTTGHNYDIMIEGKGFIPVEMANGQIGYTRRGAFHRDAQGRVMLSNGALMIPQITVPANAMSIGISPQGQITAVLPGNQEAGLGQIQLASFVNEQGLTTTGQGIYFPSSASGQPILGLPGEDGMGTLDQGSLEGSNVNVAPTMVELIQAQRGYEMQTKVMNAVDQMLGATINVRQ